jgi:hypothetical protein
MVLTAALSSTDTASVMAWTSAAALPGRILGDSIVLNLVAVLALSVTIFLMVLKNAAALW